MFQQENDLKFSFDRLKLIEKIKKSKADHLTELNSARAKLIDETIKMLEAALAKAKSAKKRGRPSKTDENWALRNFQRIQQMPVQSHETEYDEIIEMLEMAKNATIQMNATAFRQFVQGNWGFAAWSPNPYPLAFNSPLDRGSNLGDYIGAAQVPVQVQESVGEAEPTKEVA